MKIPIPNADPGPPPAGKIRNPNRLVLLLLLLVVLLLLSSPHGKAGSAGKNDPNVYRGRVPFFKIDENRVPMNTATRLVDGRQGIQRPFIPEARNARCFAKSWRSSFENEPKMTQTSTEAVCLSSKSTKIAFLI